MKTKYILKNNIDGNHNNQKQKKICNEDNIIELISNHYNVKARKERLFANKNEKSTKPSTDAKIVMTSGTLCKNLRKTDSSEFNTAYKNRDSSEKQNSKTSPYRSIKDKKCISQYTLKPKLKIVKGKDPNKIYCKKIENPFKKKLVGEFDVSSKHSNLSPHSRLKSGEISKDKKTKKKPNHKRLISSITNAKSQAILGRSQTGITEGNKSLKLLCDTLQQTYRQPLVVKNLFPKSTLFKNRESNSKNKKESSKEVIKNIEIYKRIEKELKNKLKSKSYKNIKTGNSDNENDPFLLSSRKESKNKASFCRPSLSVCCDQVNSSTFRKRSGK